MYFIWERQMNLTCRKCWYDPDSVITDVPTVTTGSGSTVYIGDDATITCLVSGTPPATAVSWQYTTNSNTTTINLGNTAKYSGGSIGTPSLTIFNVSKADEGSYRCQATNIIGTGQSVTSAFLSVIGSKECRNDLLFFKTVGMVLYTGILYLK